MKKLLWTLFLFGATTAVRNFQSHPGNHAELTRLKMSLMYVRAIKTFRSLFISLLAIGVCLVLLFAGLIVFHASLFLYAPWSGETKMVLGLLFSLFYLVAAFILFSKVFAPEIWWKIFHAQSIIDRMNNESMPAGTKGPSEKNAMASTL